MSDTNFSNNLRAGIFVLTVAAVALAVGFVLLKVDFLHKTQSLVLRFDTAEGVSGLSRGSEVKVGGLTVGRVLSITPVIDTKNGNLTSIDVVIELAAEIPVHWSATAPEGTNAEAIRVGSLVGSTAIINFNTLGQSPSPILKDGEMLMATHGSGMLTTLVGPANAVRTNEIIKGLAVTANWLKTIPEEYRTRVVPTLQNLATTTANFNQDYETWRKPIGETLQNAQSFTGNADQILKDNKGKINQVVDSTVATMGDAAATMKDARQIAAEVRAKSLPALQKLLDQGADAAGTLAGTLDQIEQQLPQRLTDLRDFMLDAREVAGQFKLAAIEVRRSPWKLLYQPKPGEMAHENLYNATRAFALATADLKTASASLQAVLAQDASKFNSDEAFRKEVREQVLESLEKYDAAQRQLFDVLAAPKAQGGEGK
ncbi:MAG: hypothetical protein K8R92_06150 [Planctomycetes bacterium]|nr:hypothetical protein [Planctomycetota bacterium]